MTWTSWRLTRPAAIGAAALVALLATYLVAAGHTLRAALDSTGLLSCLSAGGSRQTCSDQAAAFYRTLNSLTGGQPVAAYLVLLPGLLGVFVGTPILVREIESGTLRLAWTQSVTRTRWLTSRLVIAGLVVVVAQLAITLLMTYWRGPVNMLDGRFEPTGYNIQGIVPLGYALAAFALGAFVGVTVRRSAPAFAITLAGYFLIRLVIENMLRGRFMTPLTVSWVGHAPTVLPSGAHGDWLMEQDIPKPGSGYPTVIIYQPADRFWTFQALELGITVAIAATLITLTYVWVRRRSH
ncbi:ABC transporter permease subunit [Terrabacter sp. Ter38]|uniref:ABC transporter permease subunit n=1 Tax=Terrabacter sp. Ter38 TaxID=2926030 RepID=UPI0021194CF2|nr:ABC transporter permease subunit [Terrabacter sp. Ter38]